MAEAAFLVGSFSSDRAIIESGGYMRIGTFLCIGVALSLLTFVFPRNAIAQKYPVEISRGYAENIELKSDGASIDIHHDHASIILPILPFDAFTLLIYLKEDEKRLRYNDFSENVSLDNAPAAITLTDFPEKLVDSTRGILLAIPIGDATWVFRRDQILATDYEDIDGEDQSFMNQILYRPKSNDTSKWYYGLSHLGGIAEDSYWPLLGLIYKGDVIRINMVLPSYFILQFKIGEYGYILIDETVTSESYRLTEEIPWEDAYISQLSLTSRIEAGIRFGDFEFGLSYGMTNFHALTFSEKDHTEIQKWEMNPNATTSLNFQWNL